MTAPILDSRASWSRLGLALLISLIGNVGMWSIIVIMPAMQAEFGVDRADAAIPYTLTMLGFAAGNFLIGRAVDRWGVARALAASALLMAFGFAAAAMAPNIATLSALQLLIGFGTATSFGPLIADVSQWFLKRSLTDVTLLTFGICCESVFQIVHIFILQLNCGIKFVIDIFNFLLLSLYLFNNSFLLFNCLYHFLGVFLAHCQVST